MEQSSNQDASFASLKVSIDQILQVIQAQAEKKDESDILMHILASKVDIQGQRLISLEKDVRQIKATVQNISESSQTNQSQKATENLGPNGDRGIGKIKTSSSTSKVGTDYFENADKVSQFSQEITEVKCLVREEVRGLGNVCIKCSTDVTMKLDQADKTVFGPLVEATSDLKQVLRQMEDIDKGIRTIENATNQYSQTLTSLKDESLSKDKFRTALQEAVIEINTQSLKNLKDESLSKDEFRTSFLKLKNNTEKQLSLNKSQGEALVVKLDAITQIHDSSLGASAVNSHGQSESSCSFDEKLMTQQYHFVLEQIIAENQITREIIQNTRKNGTNYKCDFIIHEFSKKINTNKRVFSNIWFIDQFNTHVKCMVEFTTDGNLVIWLVYGRNPRKLGLDAKRSSGADVNVFVVQSPKKNWELKQSGFKYDEAAIRAENDGWDAFFGFNLVTVSCTELTEKEYVHGSDRLLLRFEIIPD